MLNSTVVYTQSGAFTASSGGDDVMVTVSRPRAEYLKHCFGMDEQRVCVTSTTWSGSAYPSLLLTDIGACNHTDNKASVMYASSTQNLVVLFQGVTDMKKTPVFPETCLTHGTSCKRDPFYT